MASSERSSASDQARTRAATRDVLPGVVALVAIQVSLLMVDPDGRASVGNLLWSLLPIAPAIWLVVTQVLGLRRADELQRIGQLEALAVGFGVAVLVAFAGGLADAAGIGSTRQSLQLAFILPVVAWIGTLAFKAARA